MPSKVPKFGFNLTGVSFHLAPRAIEQMWGPAVWVVPQRPSLYLWVLSVNTFGTKTLYKHWCENVTHTGHTHTTKYYSHSTSSWCLIVLMIDLPDYSDLYIAPEWSLLTYHGVYMVLLGITMVACKKKHIFSTTHVSVTNIEKTFIKHTKTQKVAKW